MRRKITMVEELLLLSSGSLLPSIVLQRASASTFQDVQGTIYQLLRPVNFHSIIKLLQIKYKTMYSALDNTTLVLSLGAALIVQGSRSIC